MRTDGDTARDPLADALAELRDDVAPVPGEPDDRYWLRVGLTLGLRRPGRAGLLLDRLEGGPGAQPPLPASPAGRDGAAAEQDPEPAGADAVPVRSMLLARAAVLPLDEPADTAFGWVSRLTQADVTNLGRVVADQIAAGGPSDLARGFGLAWTASLRIPNSELNELFSRFTDLEIAIASVLGGQQLRAIPQPGGLGGISAAVQGWFMPRRGAADGAASAVFEAGGEPAKHGLVAAWNAWAALRYRSLLPLPLFDQLVEPWTTVVGRLPEP